MNELRNTELRDKIKCWERRSADNLRLTLMFDRTASSCVRSRRFAPVTTNDKGGDEGADQRVTLAPIFSPVSRVGPDLLLRHRGLEHDPVNALPSRAARYSRTSNPTSLM